MKVKRPEDKINCSRHIFFFNQLGVIVSLPRHS